MATKTIRTAITVALTIAAVAALAVAGEANHEIERKDVPVAGARVGFALTMAKRNGSTFSCVDTVTHQRWRRFPWRRTAAW